MEDGGGEKFIYKIYKKSGKNLPGIWHWPNIVESLYLKQCSLILDAGCGVGLKMEHLKHYKVIWTGLFA